MANPDIEILVVDDDATIVKLLQLVLGQAGFVVRSANSGEDGLRMAM